jgi:hypothetical protein
MKAIASVIVCLALSACATDYVSQLSEADFGKQQSLHYSEQSNMDPAFYMNGTYASKQLYGSYATAPLGLLCTTVACSRQTPFWAQGWSP